MVRRLSLVAAVGTIAATLAISGAGQATAATRFPTLKPGSILASDTNCAGRVRPVAAEPRPDNATANAAVPPSGGFKLTKLDDQHGYDNRSQLLEARVSGNFAGTTDEIIQWSACKWGFDEDLVRAIAMTESDWHQSTVGDYTSDPAKCPPGYATPCPRSFGIHQVTWASDPYGMFPWARDSTAFNLDVSLLVHRICYEGYTWWTRDIGYKSYAAGDLWGCVGQWYSGLWHDPDAESYVTKVKGYVANKPWTLPGFSGASAPPTTTPTTVPPGTTCPCLRNDFEDGTTQGWYRGWGALSIANVTSPAHTGSRALAIKLSPSGPDWPAVQLSSPTGLKVGSRVTYWLYEPAGSTLASVQPYVADPGWNDVPAPPTVLVTGWNQVSWTVPSVSGIAAIGLQLNNELGWNGQITLDSVTW